MNPETTLAEAAVLTLPSATTFAVRRSTEIPGYHELSLADDHGGCAHWVITQPLKQLNKRPVLLWLLAASPLMGSLSCVETGTTQLAPARLGATTDLNTELKHGVLRLNFNGQLLRGYYRLQCLPTGCGQLWQFTPIGHV
ncbi:hypothetical protein [Hymenobacter negativus]|uniref:Uncharacterized protein n=1 Tax=Hymenobacter negativus TaxID=2795026 RepID=A0ABS3QJ69_9BACT|nr:hypothetical protein [Hymenobacter negativus]MBO2011295.1 hypothetical protein [Hymenobacter negativus]